MGLIDDRDVFGLSDTRVRAFSFSALEVCRALRRLRLDVALDLELFSRVGAILSDRGRRPASQRPIASSLRR